jgi:hypothetical protein
MLAKALATYGHKKIFRYNIALRNPFPGSVYSEIPGHHFLDLLFLFMTLSERYPTQRHREISVEFARRWITFANGIPPWKEYEPKDEAIAIVDYQHGWSTKTRDEDIVQYAESEEGHRRYEAWEIVDRVLSKHGSKSQDILDLMKARSLKAHASHSN